MHVKPVTGPDAYAADTVIVMSPQDTSRHTPNRVFRASEEAWKGFDEAVKRLDPPMDKSELLRTFLLWFAREPGVKLPPRPPRVAKSSEAKVIP